MPVRIFLVEDNPVIRSTVIEALQEMVGATIVGWAASEDEAIDAMSRTDWTVALVDLFLLKGTGLGVAQAFQDREPNRLLYVVTNYPTSQIREKCAQLGVDRIFDKSTELDGLFEALLAPVELINGASAS